MSIEIKNLRINSQKIVEDYISEEDWRARENANSTTSFSGLLLHAGTTVLSNYALKHLYPKRIADAHYQGFIHIHDLGHPIVGYCCGHPLRTLLIEGLKKMSHVESAPPKHFTTALDQMVNYLGVMQHEWSGAMAFNSPDTLLAPFIAYDNLSESEVKQAIQSFIFHLNMPSRWGGQLVFSNLTLDVIPAIDLKNEYITVGGEIKDETYGDFIKEQEIFNKCLFDIFYEGDANGRIFSFPIPTINITKDFPWESEISDKIFKLTAKYGTFYFSNFLNSNLNPSDIRSMCCRLSLNLNELRQNITGGLFGSSDSTGSIGVCTLNLNRIGYLANDKTEYFVLLDKYLKIAKDSLEIKREMIQKTLDAGLIPLTKHYIGGFKTFFSTIGICLKGNTSIATFDGAKELSALEEGDEIIGFDGIEFKPTFIKKKIKRKSDKIIKLKISTSARTARGYTIIEATPEHPFLVNGKWKIAEDLSVGDEIDFLSHSEYLQMKWKYHPWNLNPYERSGDQNPFFGKHHSSETLLKQKNAKLGKHPSEKTIEKLRKTNKEDMNILNILSKSVPTEDEQIVIDVIKKYDMPITWNAKGGVVIDDMIPDFIIDGQKKCIEIIHISRPEVRKKIELYRNTGWKSLIIRINFKERKDPRIKTDESEIIVTNKKELQETLRKFIVNGMKILEKTDIASKYDNGFTVYNLVCEPISTYIANSCIVHNCGMNESLLNFMNTNVGTKEGIDFTINVMKHIRMRLLEFQEETGNLYSLEASPAESASLRLALLDRKYHSTIITAGTTEIPFLTNSTQLSVDFTDDPFEAMQLQEPLQILYNSGTVQHLYVGETNVDYRGVRSLIKRACENTRLPYISFTPTFSNCPNHGFISGNVPICPRCGENCEVYSRVVGYYRPVSQFNKGKQMEFNSRKTFKIK